MAPFLSSAPAARTAGTPRRTRRALALFCGWVAGLVGTASAQSLVLPDGPVLTSADTLIQVLFGGYITSSQQEEQTEPLIMLNAYQREHWLHRQLIPCGTRYCRPKLGNVDMYPAATAVSTDFSIGDPVAVEYRFSLPPGAAADLALRFQVAFSDPTQVVDWHLRILDKAGSTIGPIGTAGSPGASVYAFGRSAGAYTLSFSAASFSRTNFTITGSPVQVPEPPLFALWSIGGLFLLAGARRRRPG